MVENKRVPANTDAVEQARDVKEEYGDTWTDVMLFYVDHRGESVAEQGATGDLDLPDPEDVAGAVEQRIQGEFDRIEEAAREATNAAQNAEQSVEELKR